MTGKHARPAAARTAAREAGRTTGRRLAAGAIILAAGATPLVAAAGAQAEAGTDPLDAATQQVGTLPVLSSLPLNLDSLDTTGSLGSLGSLNPMNSLDSLAAPTATAGSDGLAGQALPLGSILPAAQGMPALNSALPLVEAVPAIADALPLNSLGGSPADGIPGRPLLPRTAPPPTMADPVAALGALNPLGAGAPAGLSSLARNSLDSVTASAAGTLGTVSQAVPGGGVGALTGGFTPQADALTGTVLRQTAPFVDQLQQSGVPTVGDLTDRLGQTSLPMVGPVGHLTRTLPLSTVLGTANPLADTLGTATRL